MSTLWLHTLLVLSGCLDLLHPNPHSLVRGLLAWKVFAFKIEQKTQKRLKFGNEASAAQTTAEQSWSSRGPCPRSSAVVCGTVHIPTRAKIKTRFETTWLRCLSPATGRGGWHSPAPGDLGCSGKSREVRADHQVNAGWHTTGKATGWSLLKGTNLPTAKRLLLPSPLPETTGLSVEMKTKGKNFRNWTSAASFFKIQRQVLGSGPPSLAEGRALRRRQPPCSCGPASSAPGAGEAPHRPAGCPRGHWHWQPPGKRWQ